MNYRIKKIWTKRKKIWTKRKQSLVLVIPRIVILQLPFSGWIKEDYEVKVQKIRKTANF